MKNILNGWINILNLEMRDMMQSIMYFAINSNIIFSFSIYIYTFIFNLLFVLIEMFYENYFHDC
jgi:hypothetical protein